MAKKQQIILTHGSNRPSQDVIKSLKHGELLVQHASSATETALHTVMVEGSDSLVSFPSKEWVSAQIDGLNITNVNKQIEGLTSSISKVAEDFAKADTEIISEMSSAETRITSAYTELVTSTKAELQGLIDNLEAEDEAVKGRLDGHDSLIQSKFEAATANTETKVSELKESVDANSDAISVITGTTIPAESTRLEGLIEAANDNANGRVEKISYNEYTGATDTRISGIETNVGNLSTSKLDASKYNEDKSALDKELQAIKDDIAGLDGDFVTETEFAKEKESLNDAISKAKTVIATGTTGCVKVTLSSSDPNTYSIEGVNLATKDEVESANGQIQAVNNRIDTLLNTTGATETIDTIKDLIDWVNNHEEVKEGILSDIIELEGTVSGFTSTNTIKSTTDSLSGKIDALEGRADAVEGRMNTAESGITSLESRMSTAESGISSNATAITSLDSAYKQADANLESRLNLKIQANSDKFNSYYTKDEVNATVESIDTAYKAADSLIRTDFAAADTQLESRVNTELAKKADKTTVESLDSRVTDLVTEVENNEITTSKALTDLDTRVKKTYDDFAAADTQLESRVNTELAKKADNSALEALGNRVTSIENDYISSVEVTNTSVNKITASVDNHKITLNFDTMIIDGGTY